MSQKNFETFDLWSKSQFAMWSNIRFDFELIAELTRYRKSTSQCLELLDSVNHYLKSPPEKVFFDGTVKSLKYLVKKGYLTISDLPNLTHDEKFLIELLNKYSKRLDITEIISDIEEPTLRAMLLEYPNLISEVLKDNPLAGHLVGKAMLKNGITDADSLVQKVDDGTGSIVVDPDKNSKEAMKCKIIYLGLRLNNGKIYFHSGQTETINQFQNLTDTYIEKGYYERSIFNALYVAMYGSDEWNTERESHLSGCETLMLDFQLLSLPDNHMSLMHKIFLKEEVDKIGIKYFGEKYRPEGFIGSLAIKMAIVIVLFRTENFIPAGEEPEVSLFSAGAMLGALNYAIYDTGNQSNPLVLKPWFLDYFRNELDKRMAFIKLQVENGIGIYRMGSIVRAIYIPVFESFRFFCSREGLLEQTIGLLKNKNISNTIKDEVLINFTINVQKIITDKQASGEEEYYKNTFILLIIETFKGLIVNQSKKLQPKAKKYYELKDLIADAEVATIELIQGFDLSKNDSFIGYLSYNLPLKIKTASRTKKSDDITFSEADFEENFLQNIPATEDFVAIIDNKSNIQRIKKHMEELPEKEKLAVKKLAEGNEKFSDTERKAKNRGLNKIREMVGHS